jgi:hypothetical protein
MLMKEGQSFVRRLENLGKRPRAMLIEKDTWKVKKTNHRSKIAFISAQASRYKMSTLFWSRHGSLAFEPLAFIALLLYDYFTVTLSA